MREAFAVFGRPSRIIHGLHRRFRQTRIGFCAAPTLAIVMHSKKLLRTINAVLRCEFPPVFLSRNSRRGVPLHRGKTFLRNNLTRRANHRHMSSIARIKPAPGDRPRAFLIGIFESDGGRTSRRHILPTHRRLSVASELPSEPFIVEHDLLGKPLRTFPEHAPLAGTRERAGTRRGQVHVRTRPCRDDPICGSR